jgi:transcriptional regulator with XRE-family HTH domain
MTPLKAAMQRHGLTVADLCLLTGSKSRMVEYWRAGRWPPPVAILILLAALDESRIDIEWLAKQLEARP